MRFKVLTCGKKSVNIGDCVVYKKRGVYRVFEIRREKIGPEFKDYYALRSVYDERATVCVPADNEALVSQMEEILTKEQVDRLIEKSKESPAEWHTSASQRRMYSESVVASNDLAAIIALYMLYVSKKQEAIETNGKFFAHDDRVINATKKIICEAFAFTLSVSKDEVIPYIREKLADTN